MKKSIVNKLLSILNKEDIESSMLFIDTNGIPKGRQSNTFDVISNLGQNYPPPFLLETAYKQKTGEELPNGFFDNIGKGSPHFKIIEDLGFNIMAKNHNVESIKSYLEEFAAIADDWFQIQDWFEERYNFYQQFFTKENIEHAEWEDFQDMGNHIHSFNSMAIAKGNALGRMNLPIEEYRRIFLYIISGDEPINITINNLYKKYDGTAYLPYFSDSSTSELIAYAFPKKYVTYNRRDEKALEILGLKLDKVRAEKFGDKFLRYNELLQPVLEQYKTIVGQRTAATPQLELDQFFSWLYETKKADKPIRDLINRYKNLIRTKGLDDEKYKWEFIRDNKGRPNFDNDILEELKSIKFTNLLYHLSVACLKDIAKDFGPELVSELKALQDESVDLYDRIFRYKKNTLKLYRKTGNPANHHQDERTISAFLTLNTPSEYTLYKSSYYTLYCDYLGIKSAKTNHKYSHYLELIKELAEDYISKDEELIHLVKNNLGPLKDEDPNNLLLAQDMLYQVIGNNRDINYWVFQGNPKVFDFETALRNDILSNWTVSAHKDKIKVGDKVILWISGNQSGCYALAEVTSEPHPRISASNNELWKAEDKSELKADLKIIHNLVEDPILWEDIKEIEEFKEFKGGNQGTNFSATAIEYNTLKELIISNSRASYFNVKEILDPEKLGKYLEVLRSFIRENNIDSFDSRISFNVRKNINRLTFLIGNRYCISIEKNKNKTLLSFISKEILSNKSGDFKNHKGEIEAYWNIVDSFEGFEQHINDGLQIELDRNNKCPFRKWTNQDFINDVFQIGTIMDTKNKELIVPINIILYGPPGTGKTYALKEYYFPKYTDKDIQRYKFVTFHQSFSYEDFIEGIKPIMPENGEVAEDLGYKIEDGLFMEICKDAAKDPANRYAIFIDEINRGNVSGIFGELITLIETDKRKGSKNEMFNTLPYSKNSFSVPSNLDIYGTMNTADRSVEALDTALRRRFEFKEMMPDYSVIEDENVEGIKLSKVLKTINERIELLVDRDHTIGHSYFVNVNTAKNLANAFNNKIVPLLQEYFYGDYGKIGLVLGKGFIEKVKNDKIEFASFDYENANDFKTPTFVLKHVDSQSIVEAVNLLLGHIEVKVTK